jgi:hypothetical protein
MALALITTSPLSIVRVFTADVVNVNIPGLWSVQNVLDGYITPDGAYKLTKVVKFIVPEGQQTVGLPTYSIDAQGVVTQSFTTQPIPPATFIPYQTFLARLTDAEYIAIKRAIATQITSGNATVARWYDKVSNSGVHLLDASTATVKTMAVSAGLLTQARAEIVFAP